MKHFYESIDGHSIIKFSAVTATSLQGPYKRIVHLRQGNFVLLHGEDITRFEEDWREWLNLQQREYEEPLFPGSPNLQEP